MSKEDYIRQKYYCFQQPNSEAFKVICVEKIPTQGFKDLYIYIYIYIYDIIMYVALSISSRMAIRVSVLAFI